MTRGRRSSRTIVGRTALEVRRRVGLELHRLRLDAGLSLRALGHAPEIDPSYLSQVERGLVEPSVSVLSALACALGSDLSVRLYPSTGPRIHDRLQAPILDALFGLLAPVWERTAEVAVHHPARGVIDAVLYRLDPRVFVPTEVHSRI